MATYSDMAKVTGDDGHGVSVVAISENVTFSLLPDPSIVALLSVNRTDIHANDSVEYNYTVTAVSADLHNLSLTDSMYGDVLLPCTDLEANHSMSVLVDRIPFGDCMGIVTLFSDDFESGGLANWSYRDAPWSVQSSLSKNGTYAAKYTHGSVAGSMGKYINISGKFSFETYIRTTSTSGNSDILGMATDSDTFTPLCLKNGGYFAYRHGLTITNLPTTTSFAANTWYRVKIDIDLVNQTISWYVDDVYKGSTALVNDYSGSLVASGSTISMLYTSAQSTTADTYLDDLSITQESNGGLSLVGDGLISNGALLG